MVLVKLKIRVRIEEVPAIGRFLIDSLTTDFADFTALSPLYNAGYLTNANGKLAVVEGLINPKQLTAELKVITLRMLSTMEGLRGKIDKLERYIDLASGLTIGKKDFGIGKVRSEINQRDVEGLIGALKDLLKNVNNNMAALVAVGYSAAQHTALQTAKSDLTADNTAQNAKVNERDNKVIANYGLLNEFWDIMTDIGKSGRAIYKTSFPNKVDDYTIAALKRRIRQEQLKQKLFGLITFGGNPFAGAKIAIKPLLGGRRRSTLSTNSSKATAGKYELKSLAAVDWVVTVSAAGKKTINDVVTIVSGNALERNFELVALPIA